MAKELFGTDGIRGVAGEYPLDRATVHAFGVALGVDLRRASSDAAVLIGMDTRESGPWIAAQVAAGLTQQGVSAVSAGVITTPGVAYLTRTGTFTAGVMISASHNPYRDNGIKVFGHSGYKLPDEEEHTVEQEIFRHAGEAPGPPLALAPDPLLAELYLDYLASTVAGSLDGMRIVVDCGNGAAYRLAPALFGRLGAEVDAICCAPNGRNINLNCGSLHVELLRAAVLESKAGLGVAFDGDADRAIFVSGSGQVVDGDAVLLIAARAFKAAGKLDGGLVVATVMSNLGLERALERAGIQMLRTPVGDKYVLEEMVQVGAVLGGEQSGHVIFRQFATTGDGLLTALRVLEIVRQQGAGLDQLTAGLEIYPQRLQSVRVRERRSFDELDAVAREIEACQQAFGSSGRVLVRFSGTEPLARVMVEGPDLARVDEFTNRIAAAIRNEIGER
ncbi:MAG TPA: phosphoglucosamine mutase [Bryobacteraceae bacterium]|jgi:phosphoglucosamine mutase|nr:phosphoglucosamine mutase [Bryobacteraceae bacterium]